MRKIILITLCLIITNCAFAFDSSENVLIKTSIYKNKIAGNVIVYNLSNAKLHTADCEWAEKCTKNCIYKDKDELENMFFIPCAVCGGGIIDPISTNQK